MHWATLPLRTRLALGYSLFFLVTLALLSAGVYFSLRSSLRHEIIDQLQTSATLLEEDFDDANTPLTAYAARPMAFLRAHLPQVEGLDAPSLYVQATTPDGAVVVRSANVLSQTLPIDTQGLPLVRAGQAQITETTLNGAPLLMLTRPLIDNGVTVGLLQVAHPLREVNRTLQLLLISMSLVDLFALIVAIRAGSWLARRALAPVSQMAMTAQQIVRAEHLTQRVPVVLADDEIGLLSQTVNDMLSRLEHVFIAQQRFVADVSHELRTPLTALQGNLELLRHGATADTLDVALGRIEREVNRLVRLTNDLLTLAQAEGSTPMHMAPLALDDMLLEVVRDVRPLAHGVLLTPAIAAQVAINGDRDRLKQALINLVVNAIQHTPPGGRVIVGLAQCPGYAELRVSDTGSGIAPADLPHIFERFYRADTSRTQRAGGAGLGLAIVQWVAEAHGGRVAVESTPGVGSVFRMELPLPDPHANQATAPSPQAPASSSATADQAM